MNAYDHVTNPTLRAVLEGRIAPMTNTLGGCIDVTFEALGFDLGNHDIPYDVRNARHDAADAAIAAFNDGDNAAALDALRRYWSV